jgi:membrane protein implicated in regulation of membrane protease activity
MEGILAAFADVHPWHWFALGAMLIGVEIVSTTFYFLWPGIAAGLTGLVLYFFPGFGFDVQILLFSAVSVVTTFAWKRFAPESLTSAKPHPTLNRRTAQYEGRRATVVSGFANGRGAIMLDDTRWTAVADDGSDLASGETVVVTGADGVVLKVKKAL